MYRNKIFVLVGAALFLTVVIFGNWLFFSPVVSGTKANKHILKIRRGMSFNAIVDTMLTNNIIENDYQVRTVARLLAMRGRIKAGKYNIPGGTSSLSLLRQLVDGKIAIERITIPEGFTTRQIASILAKTIEIDSVRFMQLVNDSSFTRKMDIPSDRLEGFLFPDTYAFHWGMRAEDVIVIMVGEFKKRFTDNMYRKAKDMGFSITETVTLASIIEGEAILDSERKTISAVYHNRLKRGMRLQADPTIQYIIKGGPRRLLKKDLEIDSPYNTYKYAGLPPGPINNPGIASIKASLNPEDVNYLYFVANGDGSHTFSSTLNEHLRAKVRFDQYRRKVQRKQ